MYFIVQYNSKYIIDKFKKNYDLINIVPFKKIDFFVKDYFCTKTQSYNYHKKP